MHTTGSNRPSSPPPPQNKGKSTHCEAWVPGPWHSAPPIKASPDPPLPWSPHHSNPEAACPANTSTTQPVKGPGPQHHSAHTESETQCSPALPLPCRAVNHLPYRTCTHHITTILFLDKPDAGLTTSWQSPPKPPRPHSLNTSHPTENTSSPRLHQIHSSPSTTHTHSHSHAAHTHTTNTNTHNSIACHNPSKSLTHTQKYRHNFHTALLHQPP